MVSQQLSLFDTATVVKLTYKIGDLVKVKRKTPHAPLLKKGDIVQIQTIHPHNGSCKIWNEVTESWGYLYPGDFVLIPPAPAGNDSVSTDKAQVADTEYTVPPGNNDSVSSKAISTYRPCGTARSGEYFRFSYRDGSRMRHIHIRGGNTDSPISQAKVAEVRSLLASGVSPARIAAMLKKPQPSL
jgi:hypothetical protein